MRIGGVPAEPPAAPSDSSILIILIILIPPLPSADPGRALGTRRGDRKPRRCHHPERGPRSPHRSPLLTLSAGAAGGGGRGSGIQIRHRDGEQDGEKGQGTIPEGLGAAGLPYSISEPGLGRGGGGGFWAAVPHLAPGGSLAGSGAEQAGGIFILEQHCRGGWLGSCLSRQLLRGPVLAAKAHPEPGEPALGAPGTARTGSLPGGVWVPLLAPITLFQRKISSRGDGETEARSQKEMSFLLSFSVFKSERGSEAAASPAPR